MVFKYIIFLFVISTLSEGAIRQLPNVGNQIDDAMAVYSELQEKVRTAIDTAVTKLNTMSNNILDLVDSALSDGTEQITNIYNELLEELNQLKELAVKASVDISDCTKTNESKFLQLPGQLVNELDNCLNNEANTCLNQINNTVADILKTWDTVVELGNELESCGSGVICLTKLIGTMTIETAQIPQNISADIVKVDEYVATLKMQLASCSSSKVLSMTVTGGDLVDQIATCIENKIKN